MKNVIALVLVIFLTSTTIAQTPRRFARTLSNLGSLRHDSSYNGRENVFYSSNKAFPRLQARTAWRNSPGHRANLPMIGLRVKRDASGVYVVGRR